MKYIVIPDNTLTGALTVHGPFTTEKARDDEAQMFLFCDQNTTKLYFLDINSDGGPYTLPSEAYLDDLRQQWDAVVGNEANV